MCELDDEETKNTEISAVGAGLGGGLDHTIELKGSYKWARQG